MAKIAKTERGLRQTINESREILSKEREILSKETEILRDQNKRISFLISSLKSQERSGDRQLNTDSFDANKVSKEALVPFVSSTFPKRKSIGELSRFSQSDIAPCRSGLNRSVFVQIYLRQAKREKRIKSMYASDFLLSLSGIQAGIEAESLGSSMSADLIPISSVMRSVVGSSLIEIPK